MDAWRLRCALASGARRVGDAATAALDKGRAVPAGETTATLAEVARAPAVMQPVLRRAIEDPGGFRRGVLETMPKMLFALLPVFAGIVAIFYRRRKYPEHLYFAIHLHAFVFLTLAVVQLLKFTQLPMLVSIATVIGLFWIPVYATLAFRRVYGGSLVRTLAKEAGIAVLYVVTSMAGFTAMIYWVSIAA